MPMLPAFATAVLAVLSPSPQELQITASVVPGSTEARVAAAPPGGLVALLLGSHESRFPLPGGRCLGIEPEVIAGFTVADAAGYGFLGARFPVGSGAGLGFVAQAVALDLQVQGPAPAFALSPVQRLTVPARGATADLYLLFGQSNADGYADARALPASLRGPLPTGRIWNELAGAWQPLTAGVNNTTLLHPDHCGPELTLIRDLTEDGRTVYLLKFAVGQTALGPTPGGWNEWGVGANELYGELLRRLGNACAALRRDGLWPQVRGICMMQGENDALDPVLAGSYRSLLAELVQHLRSGLVERDLAGSTPVPFVLGLVNLALAGNAFQHVPAVRAAQNAVVGELPRCAAVDTTGLALQPDGVHFATGGVMALGSGFAAALGQWSR